MLGRPDAASPHVPGLATRGLIRSAVGRGMAARWLRGDRAEISLPTRGPFGTRLAGVCRQLTSAVLPRADSLSVG